MAFWLCFSTQHSQLSADGKVIRAQSQFTLCAFFHSSPLKFHWNLNKLTYYVFPHLEICNLASVISLWLYDVTFLNHATHYMHSSNLLNEAILIVAYNFICHKFDFLPEFHIPDICAFSNCFSVRYWDVTWLEDIHSQKLHWMLVLQICISTACSLIWKQSLHPYNGYKPLLNLWLVQCQNYHEFLSLFDLHMVWYGPLHPYTMTSTAKYLHGHITFALQISFQDACFGVWLTLAVSLCEIHDHQKAVANSCLWWAAIKGPCYWEISFTSTMKESS